MPKAIADYCPCLPMEQDMRCRGFHGGHTKIFEKPQQNVFCLVSLHHVHTIQIMQTISCFSVQLYTLCCSTDDFSICRSPRTLGMFCSSANFPYKLEI